MKNSFQPTPFTSLAQMITGYKKPDGFHHPRKKGPGRSTNRFYARNARKRLKPSTGQGNYQGRNFISYSLHDATTMASCLYQQAMRTGDFEAHQQAVVRMNKMAGEICQ